MGVDQDWIDHRVGSFPTVREPNRTGFDRTLDFAPPPHDRFARNQPRPRGLCFDAPMSGERSMAQSGVAGMTERTESILDVAIEEDSLRERRRSFR